MAEWVKAKSEDVASFEEAAAEVGGVELRRMFGYPAAFVNGNMAFGLYADRLMLRLPEPERSERLAAGWQPFEPMPGRPMREYVVLPAELATQPAERRAWLEQAARYAASLPPKAAKAAKAKGKSRTSGRAGVR